MTFEEFKQWIDANPENPRAKSFKATLEAATPDKPETILTPQLSADIVTPWLDSKDAIPVMQSRLDKARTEALTKFRENDLPKLQREYFDAEYAKKHPPTSEAEKQLAEIQRKFADMEREKKLSDIRTKALKAASEKKIPADIIDLLSMDEEESTLARIDKFHEILTNTTNSMVDERLKGIKPEPRTGAPVSSAAKIDTKAPLEDQVGALLSAKQQ